MAAKNATIGALRVELGLATAQFDKGLKDAGNRLSHFAKAASTAGAAVGTAMAGAAVAMGVAVKGALDAADDLVKTASKVGVAVDELSRLKHAADLSGVSMEGLSTALRKLSQNLVTTAEGGSSEAARAFQRLGITVTDSAGQLKTADQVLSEVAARFEAMPDGVQKTASAVAIFGRSGTDLIPMLNAGAEGLAAMKAEADALGIVISEETARAAEQFNDNLTRLQRVADGVTNQLAAELAPALAAVSDILVETAMDADLMRQVGIGLDRTLRGLVTGALALGAGLQFAGNAARGMNEAVGLALQGRFGEAAKAYMSRAETAVSTIEQIRGQIDRLWANAGESSAAGARAVVDRGFTPLAAGARQTSAAVKSAADAAAEALAELQRDLDRIRDKVLSPEERRAKAIAADVKTVQQAFAAGKVDAQEMHALIAGLDGGLQRMTLPLVEDLKTLGSPEIQSALDGLRDRAEMAAEAFAAVSWAIGNIEYALRNGDWAGAARGLIAVLDQMKTAWASGDPSQKLSAAGGAFSAVGSAVGGNAGVGLSGIGSGLGAAGAAAGLGAGMALAGPIGIAVGLASLVAGLGARNAAKKAEAQRRALEEYNARMDQLAKKRELEIRLMEAQGRSAEALAQRRADELAAMDAESRALQAQIYALEDKAELEARRADFDAAFLTAADAIGPVMEEVAGELARLGYSGISTRDQFRDLVLGLDQTSAAGAATYKALLELAPKFLQVADYIDLVTAEANSKVEAAKAELVAAYEREAGALRTVIDRFRAFSDTLRRFRDSLFAGPSANLTPMAQYRATRMQFDATRRAAAQGDERALEELPAVAQAYLEAARAVAPDAAAYARDLAAVRNATQAAEQIAKGEADIAEAQLAALDAQVGQLVQLNAGMMSVAEAIANLASAQAAAAAAIASAVAQAVAVTSIPPPPADTTPKIWTPDSYAAANPDVADWARTAVGQVGYDGRTLQSVQDALAYHWKHHGSMEGRGFATGGSFKVGGFGGTDSQFMPLMLTPGEMVNVRRPGQAWAGEEGLGREVADLRRAIERVAVNTRKTERWLDEFDRTGLYVRGQAPLKPVATQEAA
jgi:hypothetical protein